MSTSSAAQASGLLDLPLSLRDDVQTLTGADSAPMLFDPVTGRYTRLGAGTVKLLQTLDGTVTGRDLADRWSRASGRPQSEVAGRLALVLGELAESGLLSGAITPAPTRTRITSAARTMHRTPTATLPIITTGLARLVDPVADVLRHIPAAVRVAMAIVIAATGVIAGITLLVTERLPLAVAPYLFALAVVLLQTVVHEMWHAVVCALHGIAPRELGIAFWYGFMPIAYVDRTDSYRLRGRGGRIAICLAGPVQDLGWVSIYTTLALTVGGIVGQTAHVAVVFALYLVLFNMNPLLPTDGQQAVEAAMGEVNYRGRAMAYFAHLALRVPLPSYLTGVSRSRRYGYLGYGAVCAAYLAIMVTLLLFTLVNVARAVGSLW